MPMRRFRYLTGFVIGELTQSLLLSMGLIVFLIFAINGFAAIETARFIDNFTSHLLAAEADQAGRFLSGAGFGFSVIVSAVVLVRALDRRFSNRSAT